MNKNHQSSFRRQIDTFAELAMLLSFCSSAPLTIFSSGHLLASISCFAKLHPCVTKRAPGGLIKRVIDSLCKEENDNRKGNDLQMSTAYRICNLVISYVLKVVPLIKCAY